MRKIGFVLLAITVAAIAAVTRWAIQIASEAQERPRPEIRAAQVTATNGWL